MCAKLLKECYYENILLLVTTGRVSVAMDTTEELMKKTNEEKMRAEELTKRRMILEQQSDHLKEMKKRSKIRASDG